MPSSPAPLRVAALGCLLVSLLVSCGRDYPAPIGEGVSLVRRGLLSVEPVFPRLPGGASLTDVVEFEKVRVVLHRTDGSVALDTTVFFPVGVDSVVLATTVPLSPAAGNSGENFKLDLGYMNAAGEVVFKGGPVDLTVAPKESSTQPAPVQIPVQYSGPGSTAAHVVVSPRSVTVNEGQGFAFTAVAIDAAGNPIANTPIVWATMDPTRVSLPSSSSGSGTALGVRGAARVLVQLLTGPADTVIVTVNLTGKTLTMQSGDGQKGIVRQVLAQPVVVKVTASDGLGVLGVSVAFSVASGGGSVANASVVSDANGIASTTWTLGASVGEQTVTATATGLTGSPITFKATARSVAPTKLAFATAPPSSNIAGSKLPAIVNVLDARGDVAKTFDGPVTLALAAGSPSAPLLGTVTTTAVEGVATFADVRINTPRSGYALTANATGLTAATTSSFVVTAGPAERLEFGSYPSAGAVAGRLADLSVIARDAVGNVATSCTGTVTLALRSSSGGVIGGTLTRAAVAGVVRYDDVTLNFLGDYQLGATSPGLTAARGAVFTIRAGTAAPLAVVSGDGQSADAGSLLPLAILVSVADQYGNPVGTSGIAVSFVASNGGSVSPASASTKSNGHVSVRWTMGSTGGTQTLTASGGALGVATARATSVVSSTPAGGGEMVVIDDWNWGDNSYGFAGGSGSSYPGNRKFVQNLVNFTTTGSRATATKVISLLDRSIYPSLGSAWSNLASVVSGGVHPCRGELAFRAHAGGKRCEGDLPRRTGDAVQYGRDQRT